MFIINPYIYGVAAAYLLDTYPAAAAYSLRQLKTGVTNVVRVRRSSDSAESDFTADEITDGTLTTWTGANDGFVVTLYDQQGSNDVTQSTAANQGKIVSSGVVETSVNGLPAVLLDGSNDNYSLGTGITTTNTMTDVLVFDRASSGIKSFSYGNASAASPYLTYWFTDDQTYFKPSSTGTPLIETSNTDTGSFLTFTSHSSNNTSHWKNSVSKGTSSYTFGTAETLNRLFRRNTDYHNGYFQESIVFQSDESSNRTSIENDINEAYNMYWNGQNTGLLDTYPAAAAYSLRNLDSSYTGALVRVRRSSDNAEQDFYGDWNGDLNTAALESFCSATDGFVVTWYDQSGSSNDVTQSTAANQPQIVSSGTVLTKGSLPAAQFDGSNDYINRTALTALQGYPFSIITIGSNESSGVNGLLAAQRNASGDTSGINIQYDRSTAKGAFNLDEGATSNIFNYPAQINNADQRLQTFIITSGGNGELWKDGTSQESIASIGSFATTPTNNFEVGRQQLGSAYLNGYVQEVIIYSSDETSNRTSIETDINDYYSIY